MIIMIKDILLSQKQELSKKLKEHYIERGIPTDKLGNPLIKVILGPRRAGKSFFALHFLQKQRGYGYVNYGDERLADMENNDAVIEAMNTVYSNPKHLLLD